MTEKERTLLKMLEKDSFDYLKMEGCFYENIDDLLADMTDDLYDLFELGQKNPNFDGGSFFYDWKKNKLIPMEISDLLNFDIDKFLKYYEKEYGNDYNLKEYKKL